MKKEHIETAKDICREQRVTYNSRDWKKLRHVIKGRRFFIEDGHNCYSEEA